MHKSRVSITNKFGVSQVRMIERGKNRTPIFGIWYVVMVIEGVSKKKKEKKNPLLFYTSLNHGN